MSTVQLQHASVPCLDALRILKVLLLGIHPRIQNSRTTRLWNQSRTCHLLLHRVGTLCVNVTDTSQSLVFSLRPDSQASGLIYATFKAQNGQPCCGLCWARDVDLWWPICSYCLMADQGQSDESSSLVKLSGKFENTRAPGLGHRGFRNCPSILDHLELYRCRRHPFWRMSQMCKSAYVFDDLYITAHIG